MTSKYFLLPALFFWSQMVLLAQEEIALSHPVKESIINVNTGMLLVRTGKELYGISPTNRSIQWKNESLGKVSFKSYHEIPFTPLVVFENKPTVNSKLLSNTVNTKGLSRIMVNVVNGKVLFNSEGIGFKSVNRTLLIPERKAVLIDGVMDNELAIALYSYEGQKMLWKTNLTHSSFFKNLQGTLFKKEKVLLDKKQNVFWLRNNYLLKIDGTSGKILYEKEQVASIAIDNSRAVIFLFSNAKQGEKLKRTTDVMAYSTDAMAPLWKNPAKIQGAITEVVFDGDKLIAISSTGFNILDNKGTKQWEEMESLPFIKKIVPVNEGFLVAQEKFLSLIGKKGRRVWKKPIKISLSNTETPIYLIKEDSTAIYITPSRANKVRIENGSKIWDDIILNDADFISRNLKLKLPTYSIWYDSIAKQYPIYSNNTFYVVNGNSTNTPKPLYSFDFGRTLPDLRMRAYGYFLENDNTFFLFDTLGKLKYRKAYPSNEEPSFFREAYYYVKRGLGTYRAATSFVYNQAIESVTGTLASGELGFLTDFGSSVYGSYRLIQNPKQIIANLNELGFSSGLETVFARIQKGKKGEDYILVITPKADETKDIIRLHIPTGEEEQLKQLDNEDSFVIDQVENIVYTFNKKIVTIENL